MYLLVFFHGPNWKSCLILSNFETVFYRYTRLRDGKFLAQHRAKEKKQARTSIWIELKLTFQRLSERKKKILISSVLLVAAHAFTFQLVIKCAQSPLSVCTVYVDLVYSSCMHAYDFLSVLGTWARSPTRLQRRIRNGANHRWWWWWW